jgi:CTP-dependent riboflavin kinase
MLRLTKLTDYAIVVLAEMASSPAARLSSSQLAVTTRISEPTVAKILKQLACAGLIASYRGAQGGYCLPREAHVRRWLTMERADLGARRLSEDRLSGSLLLRRAEEEAGPKVARRSRSGMLKDL